MYMPSRTLLLTFVILGVLSICLLRHVDRYSGPSARVYGGETVIGQNVRYPWFVRTSVCGGALISPRLVLTASHCVLAPAYFMGSPIGVKNPRTWTLDDARKARVGELVTIGPSGLQYQKNKTGKIVGAYSIGGEQRKIIDVLLPPNFSIVNGSLSNDIALLVLDQPSTKQCVKISSRTVPPGSIVSVIGHGKTSAGNTIDPLKAKKGDAIAINKNDCVKMLDRLQKKTNGRYINEISRAKTLANSSNYICLKSLQTSPNTACHGDSGGPSFFDNGDPQSDILVGTVSSGATPCDMDGITLMDGVQFRTSVSANMPWIRQVAEKLDEPLNIV